MKEQEEGEQVMLEEVEKFGGDGDQLGECGQNKCCGGPRGCLLLPAGVGAAA